VGLGGGKWGRGGRGGEDGGDEGGGAEGDRAWDDLSPLTRCSSHAPKESRNHTNLAYFGGWAVGRGVYCPRKRSSWIVIALENYSAKPSPSLCKIQKASSISSYEHESEKKRSPSPRPWQRSRPRFSDPLFLQQPWFSRPFKSFSLTSSYYTVLKPSSKFPAL
jgi:hypothetical protein